jgi:hypothetical protein
MSNPPEPEKRKNSSTNKKASTTKPIAYAVLRPSLQKLSKTKTEQK